MTPVPLDRAKAAQNTPNIKKPGPEGHGFVGEHPPSVPGESSASQHKVVEPHLYENTQSKEGAAQTPGTSDPRWLLFDGVEGGGCVPLVARSVQGCVC